VFLEGVTPQAWNVDTVQRLSSTLFELTHPHHTVAEETHGRLDLS
jgi:hypothetical protein